MTNTSKTVAISRQRGSGGSYIGRAIADRLSLRYIDRQMLRDAAEYLRTHDPEERVETTGSWWSRLGQTLALGVPEAGYAPPVETTCMKASSSRSRRRSSSRWSKARLPPSPP